MEFALILPLLFMCMAALFVTVLICLQTLHLNDTARVVARAVATSDEPQLTAQNMTTNSNTSALVSVDNITQVLTVQLIRKIRLPILGILLPVIELRASSHILSESPPLLPESGGT